MSHRRTNSSFDQKATITLWSRLERLNRTAKLSAYSLIMWFDRLTLGRRRPAVLRHVCGSGSETVAENLCIFAHYDKHDRVDDYVLYLLRKLRELGSDIVFVSTATKLGDESISKLKAHCSHIVVRSNLGYDFGSWKVGFDYASNLSAYRRLILANDSVYGPLHDLRDLFAEMRRRSADFWGITDSYELRHHLQSYFIVFERTALECPAFSTFWKSLPFYRFKRSVIRDCEIGLPHRLRQAGLRLAVAYDYISLRNNHRELVLRNEHRATFAKPLNPSRSLWDLLIRDCACPFLKVDVLRDNPENSEAVSDWPQVLESVSDYNPRLIQCHLARMHDRP